MKHNILNILDNETRAFNNQTKEHLKLGIMFNIIEIKAKSNNNELKKELYLDMKKMVSCYVNSIDETYSSYLDIDEEGAKDIINKVSYLEETEQLNLLEFVQRKLTLLGYKTETELFDERVNKLKIKVLLKERSLSNIVRAIGINASMNIYSLLISFICCIILYSLILLPAQFDWMVLFKTKYSSYNDDFYVNHFYNTTLSLLGIDDDFKIIPLNFLGFLLLIALKVFFLAILFNYLSAQLKTKFKIK